VATCESDGIAGSQRPSAVTLVEGRSMWNGGVYLGVPRLARSRVGAVAGAEPNVGVDPIKISVPCAHERPTI
jgi:hypothetical protein